MIGIIGVGWLGLPLAQSLESNGFTCKGSTSSVEKLGSLREKISHVDLLQFQNGSCKGNLDEFLSGLNTLIITLPPKSNTPQYDFYLSHLKLILTQSRGKNIEKLIFTSSTGVFEDTCSITEYNELSSVEAFDKKSRLLIEAEQLILNSEAFNYKFVVRLGGLVAIDRQPVKYLSGKPLKNSFAPVNLIHQDDAVEILRLLIDFKQEEELIFHAVYPLEETREEYYLAKANELKIPPPLIEESIMHKEIKGKKISSVLSSNLLSFVYKKRP